VDPTPKPSQTSSIEHPLEPDGESLVVKQVMDLLHSKDYRPPQLPSTAVQLLELAKEDNVQPTQMVTLLERDPLLAAELLRLAQSSLYGGSFSVRTLDEAIVRLGLQRTADLFLHAALETRVFKAKGYKKPMDQLRRHSVAVAHLSRLVGREAGVFDQSAFMCGLLHDVGIAASLIAVVECTPQGKKPPPFEEIWPAVSKVHQIAGGILASSWNFPSDVTLVIERHHSFMIRDRPHPLATVVYLADWTAAQLGFGFMDEQDDDGGTRALEILQVGPTQAQKLLSKASKTLENVT